MTLPLDLVLIRHGESEGNLALRQYKSGETDNYSPEFLARHTRSFRLTEAGRAQAARAAAMVKAEFLEAWGGFDRCLVSEYARAMETAALLDIPGAQWYTTPYLAERDWGELDRSHPREREGRLQTHMELQHVEPYFWKPLNGESFNDLCLRVDRVLDTLHRECAKKRVVIVCHGEVMWAFRMRIERMPHTRFKELHLSKEPMDRLWNCQMIHYTRVDPSTGEVTNHANWMRTYRPTADPVYKSEWHAIIRPTYSNDELMQIVESYERMIEA